MKNIPRMIVVLLLCSVMLTASVIASFAEAGSHGLYVDPDVSATSKTFNGFMIDFQSTCDNALCTYWELAGFRLNTTQTVKKLKYIGLSGGGGYAGIQTRYSNSERVAIMSFWEYEYTDPKTHKKTILNAEQIYPEGSSTFGNEGSGVNWIKPYAWVDHEWYRMLILTWNDEETDRTFAGTWLYDYKNDEWTLYVYFNTNLYDSYFEGGFGQFIENWTIWQGVNKQTRSCMYRNFYAIDHKDGEWKSLNKVKMTNDNNSDCVGNTTMGISDDKTYIWESANGSSSEKFVHEEKTVVLTQPSVPSYSKPSVDIFKGTAKAKSTVFTWEEPKSATPQLSYVLEVFNENGESIAKKSQTRPEIRSAELDIGNTEEYKAVLTVTDVFGQSVTKEYVTKNYTTDTEPTSEQTTTVPTDTVTDPDETIPETGTDVTDTPATEAKPTETKSNDESTFDTTGLIIVIAAAAVIAAGAAAFIIFRKRS